MDSGVQQRPATALDGSVECGNNDDTSKHRSRGDMEGWHHAGCLAQAKLHLRATQTRTCSAEGTGLPGRAVLRTHLISRGQGRRRGHTTTTKATHESAHSSGTTASGFSHVSVRPQHTTTFAPSDERLGRKQREGCGLHAANPTPRSVHPGAGARSAAAGALAQSNGKLCFSERR